MVIEETMETIKLHDVVAHTTALPDYNPRRGKVGVVIDIGPNDHYLLEFADRNGVAYSTLTISRELLHIANP
jgi:hypothetical protein